MRIQFGQASVEVQFEDDRYVVSDLQSGGKPCDLLKMLREIARLAKAAPVLLWVERENPKFDQLKRVYTRLGAVEKGIIMEVGGV